MKDAQPITPHYRGLGFLRCPGSFFFCKGTKCIYSSVGFVEARKDSTDKFHWRQLLRANGRGKSSG